MLNNSQMLTFLLCRNFGISDTNRATLIKLNLIKSNQINSFLKIGDTSGSSRDARADERLARSVMMNTGWMF